MMYVLFLFVVFSFVAFVETCLEDELWREEVRCKRREDDKF